MVTNTQFYLAIRSYEYRKRLSESLDGLEAKIHGYMHDRGVTEMGMPGYYVNINGGKISVEKKEMPDIDQLYLEFYKSSDNGKKIYKL